MFAPPRTIPLIKQFSITTYYHPLHRLFFTSRTLCIDWKDKDAVKEYKRAWYLKRCEDPNYFEEKRARCKASLQIRRKDPEWAENQRARLRAWRKSQRESPDSWTRMLLSDRKRHPEKRSRYHSDPQYRARSMNRSRVFNAARWRDDSQYRRCVSMRQWLIYHCPHLERFSWKTHKPIIYPKRTLHLCSGCGVEFHRGARLWWKRNTEPDAFDCHKCFCSDWSRALPIGFEDHKFAEGKPYPKPIDGNPKT